MRAESFQTASGTVRYWVDDAAGAGVPWLVFLPGLTADHTLFDAQMAHFSGRELPGVGRSGAWAVASVSA